MIRDHNGFEATFFFRKSCFLSLSSTEIVTFGMLRTLSRKGLVWLPIRRLWRRIIATYRVRLWSHSSLFVLSSLNVSLCMTGLSGWFNVHYRDILCSSRLFGISRNAPHKETFSGKHIPEKRLLKKLYGFKIICLWFPFQCFLFRETLLQGFKRLVLMIHFILRQSLIFLSFFFSANRVETIRFLLRNGASVNPTYPGGNT